MNGAADKIHGYDDGEAAQEMRDTPAAPYEFKGNELEVLQDIERLTELNK
jgi:hypothetical protein